MALVKCKECGKDVSTSAKVCPHCGIKSPGVKASDALKGFALIFVVIFIIAQCSDSDDKPTSVDAKPQVSETECIKTLQCWGEKHAISAGAYCQRPIEKLAKYSFEWLDGAFTPRFSYYRWKDQPNGYVTYIGDKIKLQNGFGAWSNYTYECDFNPATNTVIDVRIGQGTL